jgi:hypothetical protein
MRELLVVIHVAFRREGDDEEGSRTNHPDPNLKERRIGP